MTCSPNNLLRKGSFGFLQTFMKSFCDQQRMACSSFRPCPSFWALTSGNWFPPSTLSTSPPILNKYWQSLIARHKWCPGPWQWWKLLRFQCLMCWTVLQVGEGVFFPYLAMMTSHDLKVAVSLRKGHCLQEVNATAGVAEGTAEKSTNLSENQVCSGGYLCHLQSEHCQ